MVILLFEVECRYRPKTAIAQAPEPPIVRQFQPAVEDTAERRKSTNNVVFAGKFFEAE
jgi:hypothetical protein